VNGEQLPSEAARHVVVHEAETLRLAACRQVERAPVRPIDVRMQQQRVRRQEGTNAASAAPLNPIKYSGST
jgi:hypothetical protein